MIEFTAIIHDRGYLHHTGTNTVTGRGLMRSVDLFDRPAFGSISEIFARVRDADDLCKFMSAYGPALAGNGFSYSLDELLELAKEFREIFEAHRVDADDMAIERVQKLSDRPISLQVVPRFDELKGCVISIQPSSLLNLMRLQVLMKISGSSALHTCKECGNFFFAGPGSDRRRDAQFCSPEHQISYNNMKRKKLKSR